MVAGGVTAGQTMVTGLILVTEVVSGVDIPTVEVMLDIKELTLHLVVVVETEAGQMSAIGLPEMLLKFLLHLNTSK